jgi:hypothetical protein
MKTKNVYNRKISSEEASEGYILVLKNKLNFFPSIGKQFTMVYSNQKKKVKVESYPCTCQGPDLPHEHYFIRWKGLKAKESVEIEKDSRKEGRYVLSKSII